MKPIVLPQGQSGLFATGVTEAAVPAVAAQLLVGHGKQSPHPPELVILLDQSQKAAEQWAEDLSLFLQMAGEPAPALKVFSEIPDVEEEDPRLFNAQCDRLAVLAALRERKLQQDQRLVVASTLSALFQEAPTLAALEDRQIHLKQGEACAFQDLVERLGGRLGYYHEAVCEGPGQFAVRGGIIDVYPLNAESPFRLDFFGDELDSIRVIDPTTQRSADEVATITIASAGTDGTADGKSDSRGAIFEFIDDEPVSWFMREPGELLRRNGELFHLPERSHQKATGMQLALRRRAAKEDHWVALGEIETEVSFLPRGFPRFAYASEPLSNYRRFPDETHFGEDRFEAEAEARRKFLLQLRDWQDAGEAVTLILPTDAEERRLREILNTDPVLEQFEPRRERGSLHEGFRIQGQGTTSQASTGQSGAKGRDAWPSVPWTVVTASEIFGRQRNRLAQLSKRQVPRRSAVDQALDFSELADGDPLVHLSHGICLFRGLQRMRLKRGEEEMISVEFHGGAMLHVPLHESHLLTRYIGLTKAPPKLGKLGTNSWEKTRAAAERATLDFASELLKLQATRENAEGYAFPPDNHWQVEFEGSFPFKETPDQLHAIQATKEDMERGRPMDRLVCGDVGFGKTEVAIRSAFKAVLGGRQVAILVPTTVLCQQHFNTFRERMAEYPVIVEMVSRFRTDKQNAAIIRAMREGRIDIVIGTHRLLSEDVDFGKLGLLVIDEEQRFGVKQKERLKELRANVDILTLSATPIPRTLYMALAGARELSVIETPPADRLPIQTVVKNYDPELVRTAIRRELDRGGQVFYLHNRVGTIDKVAGMIEEMMPGVNVGVGHGQMDEGMLEKVMTKFVAGGYDVLVCTTIIESGLDIPNCNTLIIEGADRFGLSQLYQIRGRVGRFKRQAYAYLLLHKKSNPADPARKRLAAIRQYNQLGAGFRIAMRDLELRGAGNILGAQQSGHIAGVGFDLYCQLLRQSVSRLKGEETAAQVRCTVRLDFIFEGRSEEVVSAEPGGTRASAQGRGGYSEIKAAEKAGEGTRASQEAFLPESYISESRLRIDFYRRLALADSPDHVREIAEALEDRFGEPPRPVEALLKLTEVRCAAEAHGFNAVETDGDRLKLQRVKPDANGKFVQIGNRFPRLSRKQPLARLKEILRIIKRAH